MAIRECDCKEFQDSGHTDECNAHYKPSRAVPDILIKEVSMTDKSSLQVSDDLAAAVAVAPRVTLQSIEDKIAAEYSFTADRAIEAINAPVMDELKILTVAILVMKNGFTVIGKSAPASPENFDAELGRKFAREDAIRQIWSHEGYALREKLAA